MNGGYDRMTDAIVDALWRRPRHEANPHAIYPLYRYAPDDPRAAVQAARQALSDAIDARNRAAEEAADAHVVVALDPSGGEYAGAMSDEQARDLIAFVNHCATLLELGEGA